MRQKSNSTPTSSETLVRNIRRATRKHHAAEEKIRIVLDGLRGETSIAELCRREGIAESMYYSWSTFGGRLLVQVRSADRQSPHAGHRSPKWNGMEWNGAMMGELRRRSSDA